ncbi:MAG: hypothetical protein IPO22_15255 [Anaerolineales bacterium]|nr:hypothetical protein [Anaerolineales bacterium]
MNCPSLGDETIEGWSSALEMRDLSTAGHSIRVAEFTLEIARRAGMSSKKLIHVRRVPLATILAKIGIPDSIFKETQGIYQRRTKNYGKAPHSCIQPAFPIEFLQPALDIPYCHHENGMAQDILLA